MPKKRNPFASKGKINYNHYEDVLTLIYEAFESQDKQAIMDHVNGMLDTFKFQNKVPQIRQRLQLQFEKNDLIAMVTLANNMHLQGKGLATIKLW